MRVAGRAPTGPGVPTEGGSGGYPGWALVYAPNLLVSSRLRASLEGAGWAVEEAPDPEAFLARLSGAAVAAVDLASPGDPVELVRRGRSARPEVPIVAFGPHVDVARLEAARSAGAGLAVSNGAMMADAPAILDRAVRGRAGE